MFVIKLLLKRIREKRRILRWVSFLKIKTKKRKCDKRRKRSRQKSVVISLIMKGKIKAEERSGQHL
jgi:hypothetical protein